MSESPTSTPYLSSGQSAIFASFAQTNAKNGTPGGAPQGKLLAVRVGDTAPVWTKSLAGVATPVIFSNGALYCSVIGVPDASSPTATILVDARRASDGKELWTTMANSHSTLVAADAGAAYVLAQGSGGGQLQALRASDGNQLWSTAASVPPVGAGPAGGGTLANGSLYVVTFQSESNSGPSATLMAVRASDGFVQWSAPLPGQFNVPEVKDGMVYVSGFTFGGAGQPSSILVEALHANDGTKAWSATLGGGSQAVSTAPVVVSSSAVYAAFATQSPTPSGGGASFAATLVALNPATGATLSSFPLAGIATSLFADSTALYVTSVGGGQSGPTGTLTAYSRNDGNQIWTHQGNLQRIIGELAGNLVALSASPGSDPTQVTGAVETISPASGSVQWQYSTAGSGPVTADVGTIA